MDITPLIPEGRQIIQAYAEGRFRISGRVFEGPVVVFPDQSESWGAGKLPGQLTLSDFASLLARRTELDVVLVGCGKTMTDMPFGLRSELKAQGLPADFMNTGAACRTYNVLMSEGRRVAAALLPT